MAHEYIFFFVEQRSLKNKLHDDCQMITKTYNSFWNMAKTWTSWIDVLEIKTQKP